MGRRNSICEKTLLTEQAVQSQPDGCKNHVAVNQIV